METDIGSNITEELAALMPLKGTIIGAELYVKKVLQSVDITIQKLMPSIVGRNSDVPLLDTPRKSVCEIPQNDKCYSHFRTYFIRSNGMSCQFEDFLRDVESEYRDTLY